MTATTCADQDCNQSISRPNHSLCYNHYRERRDEAISLCSDCQVTYKPAEYPVCRNCYRGGSTAFPSMAGAGTR